MGLFSKKEKLKSPSPAPLPSQKSNTSTLPSANESRSNALFGDRKAGNDQDKQNPYASNTYASTPASESNPYSSRPGDLNPGGYGNSYNKREGNGTGGNFGTGSRYGAGRGYANSDDRQLTAEEEEEEDVEAVKQQIRFTKQESVSSTRNALRVAAQAEETGRSTLARLGQQGERLYNTEKNLDLAYSHNRAAEEKARELKTLNGSMFAIHMKNPMKSKARQQSEEQKILDTHQFDRDERERARQFGYESQQHVNQALSGRGGYQPSVDQRRGPSMTEREKYQFEADETDDDMEREIDDNLKQLGHVTSRLHALAVATGQEADRQSAKIAQLGKKSDRVDDGIVLTHNRIKKIH